MTDLIIRQKEYEDSYNYGIIKRIPVIIRANGISFSKVLRDVPKPFCEHTAEAMSYTMFEVIKQIDSAIIAYTHFGEINFILFSNDDKEPWLNNRVQKLSSRISSLITYYFNRYTIFSNDPPNISNPPLFDCISFGVPSIAEAINYLIHRQQENNTKSIQEACLAEIGRKYGRQDAFDMIKGVRAIDRVSLLKKECGITYEKYPHQFRLGSLAYKVPKVVATPQGNETSTRWYLDKNPPNFTTELRKRLGQIFYTGSDIFRPERDLKQNGK